MICSLLLNTSAGRNACTFVEREQFSAWQLGRGVLGAFLFLKADALVNSIYFRLSTGTGGFVLLSFLILAFVIYRWALDDS